MASVFRTMAAAHATAVFLTWACMDAANSAAAAPDTYPLTLTSGSRLMIGARVDGHDVSALLDSAAEVTILDGAFAQSLGLRGGDTVTGQGSGQSSFEAKLIHGVRLEALGLSLADQTVAVADLTDVGHRLLNRRLDVILGREIFDAARLAIDIEAGTIAVASSERPPPGVRLELVTEHGVETLPVRVAGAAPVRATFDLGNGSRVLVSQAYAERMKLLGGGRATRFESGGGLGGAAARPIVTLPEFELAGRRFEGIEAAVDPQSSASDLNVGIAILRHFRITTDFAQHSVWLEPRD